MSDKMVIESVIFVTKIYIFFVKQKENCVHRKKRIYLCNSPKKFVLLKKNGIMLVFSPGELLFGQKTGTRHTNSIRHASKETF